MNRRVKVVDAAADEVATRPYYYWLLAALFCEYARPASYIPPLRIPFLYSILPLALFAVTLFMARGMRPMKDIFADPIAKWVPIFLGLMILSMGHADVTFYAWNQTKLVLGQCILFLLIARIATTPDRLRGVFITLLFAHLFLLAMNPQVLLNPDVRNYIIGATFLGDGNDFSLSLCILLPLTFEVALATKSRFRKILAWFGVVLLLFAIVASQSRGATIGLGAVLLFLWLFSPRKGMSLLGVLLVVGVVLLYAPPAYFSRMGTMTDYENEGSASARIEAWKAATRMANDSPLLGVGAGQFPSKFGSKKYHPAGIQQGFWMTAHSSYFLVFGELGYPGIIVLLLLVISNISGNMKIRKLVKTRAGPDPPPAVRAALRMLLFTAAAVIGFAVAGAFLSAAYYPHVYVLAGMLVAARSFALQAAGIPLEQAWPKGSGARRRRPAPST